MQIDLSELGDQIKLLAEQKKSNCNEVKFSKASIEELTLLLSSRNYANATWELAHLYWLLAHSDDTNPILNFFYIREVSSGQTAKLFFENKVLSMPSFAQWQISENGIAVSIRDHEFVVNWSRFNLLSLLTELLINIELKTLERYTQSMGKGLNAIKALAGEFQKDIYEYLEQHMPSVRSQKKFIALHNAFTNKSLTVIDQEFAHQWSVLSEIEGFAKFTNFYQAICIYFDTIEATAKISALEEEASGQISEEESIFNYLVDEQEKNILDALCDIPKALSQKQKNTLLQIMQSPKQMLKLPLSALAVLSFSPMQGKVLQAVRNQVGHDKILALLDEHQCYSEQIKFLTALVELNQQTIEACLAVLITHHGNNIDVQSIPDEKQEKAYKSLKQNNRKGFTDDSIVDDGTVYVDVMHKLNVINGDLKGLLRLHQNHQQLDEKYEADRFIVTNEFKRRYCT